VKDIKVCGQALGPFDSPAMISGQRKSSQKSAEDSCTTGTGSFTAAFVKPVGGPGFNLRTLLNDLGEAKLARTRIGAKSISHDQKISTPSGSGQV
jgi:hypothetical protein